MTARQSARDDSSQSVRFSIAKDHPALAGHFPGEPVVPAVVLLEQLIEAIERQVGHALRLVGLAHAKFPSPLLPEEEARAVIVLKAARLEFEVAVAVAVAVAGQGADEGQGAGEVTVAGASDAEARKGVQGATDGEPVGAIASTRVVARGVFRLAEAT